MTAAYVLFGCSAVLLILAGLLAVRVVLLERSWVETSAEILETNIESFVDRDNRRLYRTVYLLRYKADRDMREALVRSTDTHQSRDEAVAKVATRPQGSRCPIHYDPHAPGQVNTNLATGRETFRWAFATVLAALSVGVLGATVWYVSQGAAW